MNNTYVSPAWSGFRRWFYLIAAILAALLLLSWLLGYGPGGSACKVPSMAAAPAATASVAAPARAAPPAPVVAPVAAPTPAPVAAPTPATTPAAVAAVPPVAAAAQPRAPTAPGEIMAKAVVYFALDKFALPADTKKTLAKVVAYLKAHGGAKAYVSGFHDPSGDQAHNEELALERARAVRSALEADGIARERITMDKPQVTTGTGTPRQARRVEVTVR